MADVKQLKEDFMQQLEEIKECCTRQKTEIEQAEDCINKREVIIALSGG